MKRKFSVKNWKAKTLLSIVELCHNLRLECIEPKCLRAKKFFNYLLV